MERLSDQVQPPFPSLSEAGRQFRVEQRRGESRLEAADGVRFPQRLQVIALGPQQLPRSRRPDRGIHGLQRPAPVLCNPARVPRPPHLAPLHHDPRDSQPEHGSIHVYRRAT